MFEQTDLMFRVREGMDVYDRYGDRIGTVEFVTFGDGDFDPDDTFDMTEQARERREIHESRRRDVLADLDTAEHIPYDIRLRMEQDGFVLMDAGLLRADRYILPEQIINAGANKLVVRAMLHDLIKT
jgi:hypothetical protein